MTLTDILKESWISITGNKLRSFLTILGIIIGVMAVVIMVAVGEAVQKKIDDEFSSIGTNMLVIRAGAANNRGISGGNRRTLTLGDAEIISKLPDVTSISPVDFASAQIINGNKNWATSIVGSYPDYQNVMGIDVRLGGFFDYNAERFASTYVVLGQKIVDELELGDDPVGQVVRIMNIPFIVIGVTESRGESSMGGPNQDDMAFIPMSTLKKRVFGSRFPDSVSMIAVKLNSDTSNDTVIEQITEILRVRHKIKDGDQDDFQVMNMKQILDTMNTITGFMKLLLISIASISLLVGSIGIMNMMLVSVAERTREIGIRKAIGAKERHIMIQFLSESVMISFLGSLLGLILGIVASQIGGYILGYVVPISMWSVTLSVIVALIVGIASGVFPAIKATKLNPIDSLRYE